MRLLSQPLSRRCLLAGAAAAAAGLGAPPRAPAQTTPDRLRLLHAQGAGGGTQASSPGSLLRYENSVPGPILRVKRGDELRVRLVNDLGAPTSVHWHGIRLPNAMDGVPQLTQPAVAPGASFDYRFRPPDAGTFWYHAPVAAQIDQGLYGALIVEETRPVAVDRDVVLVLSAGGEDADALKTILVNGLLRPDITVKRGERVRLRLINATAMHGLVLRLENHALWVMAIDGQPAEPVLARDSRIALGPGNRADLFVDMTRAGGAVAPLVHVLDGEHTIARLVYDEAKGQGRETLRPQPLPLPQNALPARIDLKSSLKAELMAAAAKPLDPAGPPLFAVRRGQAVTLAISNHSSVSRVVHVHGHHFRLLDRLDDGWKPYWLDTLVVGAGVERIAFVADNPGKWLINCRTLEQGDADAGLWFAVD